MQSGGESIVKNHLLSRREVLAIAGAALASRAIAQTAAPPLLPLQTTGLEHLGMTVPDQKASAEFYGRIFDPQLFQERDPPPRYYVRLGTAYLAFGGTATPDLPAKIDHFCALVKDYKPDAMRPVLEQAGISMGAGRLGMPTDSDGLRLQLLGVPGGLARTIIPSTRITTDDAAIEAIGLDHLVLTVSDMDKASTYYSKFFGPPVSRAKKPERIWFGVAQTRLALEPVPSGGKPAIERVCVRIAGFDKKLTAERLKKVGVETVLTDDHLLRFKDPNGFTIELKAGA
jgi:catechol 2,3-dioxygenase-like lactoylglutathione lyase family enzyme